MPIPIIMPAEANPPLGIILRPRRRGLLCGLAICLGFTAIGIAAIERGHGTGWFVAGFFGPGAAVFLVSLLPGAAELRIAAEGITICSLFRRHFFAWAEIDGFGMTAVQARPLVGFNLQAGEAARGRLRRLSRAVSGYDAALPDTYGLAAADLAALLQRALSVYRGSN